MSSSARRRSREFALQGLYQWLLSGTEPAAIHAQLKDSGGFAKCDSAFFDTLWRGVSSDFDFLLGALTPYLNRAPRELSPIEKALLVIAAWELLRSPEVPYRVVIDEAVELAKAYGATDGYKFVNGVLDKFAAAARAPEVSAPRV
jgi:N utilization substance protein B